jgi:branched-chain amino acid transport system permease protein
VAFVGGVIGGLGSLSGAALGGFVLGAIINVLSATLPITLKSHTQLFAFLVVIGILVFIPNGLVSVRASAFSRIWRRLRRIAPAEEAA